MRIAPVNECLVLMQFGTSKAEIAHSHFVYEALIVPAIRLAGLENLRIDREFDPRQPVIEQLSGGLRQVHLVIADLSGNNANVYFELGFRYARGLPFVCISCDPALTAFWGRTFPVVPYDGPSTQCIERLAQAIRVAGSGRASHARASVLHLGDALAEVSRDEPNHLADRWAAWRIDSTRAHVESLRGGGFRTVVRQPREQVARLFEELAQQLQAGDEYLTVTNADFWSTRQMGHVGFLEQNVSAVARGANLRRVYLVDATQDHDSAATGVIEQLRDQQDAMAHILPNATGRFELYLVASLSYTEDLQTFGHFALVRSDAGGVQERALIVPHHASRDLGGDITSLEVRFSPSTADRRAEKQIETYEARFATALRLGYHIEPSTDVRGLLRAKRVEWLKQTATRRPPGTESA